MQNRKIKKISNLVSSSLVGFFDKRSGNEIRVITARPFKSK